MTIENRELIESIASTAISKLGVDGVQGRFCNFSVVKASILKLGISCLVTPWPDGAASGLTLVLRQAAFVLRFDHDSNVSTIAYSAMGICNMAVAPRAPPLVIVTRLNDSEATTSAKHRQFFSRDSLENGMESAKEDILKSKIIEKETQEKKKKKKEVEKKKKQMMESEKSKVHKVDTNAKVTESDNGSGRDKFSDLVQPPNEHVPSSTEEDHQSKDEDLPEIKDEDADISMSEEPSSVKVDIEEDDNVEESSLPSDKGNDSDASDDDFPPIIDCAPDDEDM